MSNDATPVVPLRWLFALVVASLTASAVVSAVCGPDTGIVGMGVVVFAGMCIATYRAAPRIATRIAGWLQ